MLTGPDYLLKLDTLQTADFRPDAEFGHGISEFRLKILQGICVLSRSSRGTDFVSSMGVPLEGALQR